MIEKGANLNEYTIDFVLKNTKTFMPNIKCYVLSLLNKEEIFGFGIISYENNKGWLGPSFIKEEYRGKGFQKFLIKKRLEIAKSIGLEIIDTAVDENNPYSLQNILDFNFKFISYCINNRHFNFQMEL